MRKHKEKRGEHPENPERIRAIWDNLNAAGILQRCAVLNPRIAEDDQFALVQNKDHIDLMKNISFKTCRNMRHTANRYRNMRHTANRHNSIYFNKGSSEAAYLVVGFFIEATEQVAKGDLDSAFASHHAEASQPMGFCLLNNIAIATSVILNQRVIISLGRRILKSKETALQRRAMWYALTHEKTVAFLGI